MLWGPSPPKALAQAKDGRLHILSKMNEAITETRFLSTLRNIADLMDMSFASAVNASVYINTYTGSVKYEVLNEHTSENKFHIERRKKYTSSAAQPITVSAYLDIKIPPKIGYAGAVSFILRIDNI